MTPEYQFYHGALLHELVIESGIELRIQLYDFHGRPDSFLINNEIGLYIKHATARITPWVFTFAKEHVAELKTLREKARVCFVGLVCEDDGFVCIRDADLLSILTPTGCDAASVRVDRRTRKMYRVSSSGSALDRKLAKGVVEIVEEIRRQNTEYAPPSCVTSALGCSTLGDSASSV